MIWNMNQTKKAYQCKNVKTRTTINWSSCANDGISKDKHFSRLQGHNLLDNNVNLKLKFSCCLGQDLQVHATAPLYLHEYCKNPNIKPNPKHYPLKYFQDFPKRQMPMKSSRFISCHFLETTATTIWAIFPQLPSKFLRHWTKSSILWKWSGRDDQAWLKMKRWGETIPNMTRSERRPRTEESIRKALSPTGGHGEALDAPAKTNRNKLKCVSC